MDYTMLLCKFGVQILPVRLSCGTTKLEDVLSNICSRWKNLSVGGFSLSYALDDGYCRLYNEDDFANMFFLFSNCDRINAMVEEEKPISDGTSDSMSEEDFNELQCTNITNIPDPLEKFCRHARNRYLTEGWAELIEEVGQQFTGGVEEFREVLQKYAIENGFEYNLVKNDKTRVTANCVVDGCEWHVHAILNRVTGAFYVKEFQKEHNCGSTYRTNNHKRVTSSLIANEIAGIVEKKPKTTPIDMIDWFADKYGLDLGYHSAWLAVEKARAELFGDYEESFDKLQWYVEAAKVKNPGSVMKLEYDPVSHQFLRLFVAFNACINGFNHCRPFLCLDGTHLKGRYKGTLLAATGKDADQGLFPIAYAIVDAENDVNWVWFLGLLKSILSPRPITFITDRHPGLVNNIPMMFPNCHHGYCLYHLQMNLKTHFAGRFVKGFRKTLNHLFKDCAYAPTVSAYNERVAAFYTLGGERAKTFIASVGKEHWCNAFFGGHRYGEMTSSAVESFNNWILKLRHLPIMHLVNELGRKIMKQMATRREECRKWNSVICPTMDKVLADNINMGRSWRIIKSRNGLYEVRCLPPVVVSFEDRTCSCGYWQANGFLCKHAATVIVKARGGEGQLTDYIDPYYRVDAYRLSYEENIFPVVELEIPDVTEESDLVIEPPRNRRPPGRPKVKRIPSRGESSSTRSMRCSRCHKVGKHNRRSCKDCDD